MNFKLAHIYTKEIERTKSKLPGLWEESYLDKDNIHHITIITDNNGEKIKPLYIRTVEDSKTTALLPIRTAYYIIHALYDIVSRTLKIYIGWISDIRDDTVSYKIISIIKGGRWKNFHPRLNAAVSAVQAAVLYSQFNRPIYINNTTITMTSKKYIMSLDCESDGLFGKHIAVAMIIYNYNKEIIDSLYAAVENPDLQNPWAIENIKINYDNKDLMKVKTSEELLKIISNFYKKYISDSVVLSDVPFPVETGLLHQLTEGNMDLSPYPIIDLASLMIAKGYNFNRTRVELYKTLNNGMPLNGQLHDPYYDAILTAQLYFKLMEL